MKPSLSNFISAPYVVCGIMPLKGGVILKDILGEDIIETKPDPPNNGICPTCEDPIAQDVLGMWYCKSCDWTTGTD